MQGEGKGRKLGSPGGASCRGQKSGKWEGVDRLPVLRCLLQGSQGDPAAAGQQRRQIPHSAAGEWRTSARLTQHAWPGEGTSGPTSSPQQPSAGLCLTVVPESKNRIPSPSRLRVLWMQLQNHRLAKHAGTQRVTRAQPGWSAEGSGCGANPEEWVHSANHGYVHHTRVVQRNKKVAGRSSDTWKDELREG